MRLFFVVVTTVLLFSGCSTLQVDVDYDRDYDFNNKITYAVVHNDKEGDNTLINDRIIKAIKSNLNARNYREVAKNQADLIVVFHVNVMNMSDVRTDYQQIGYGGYGYGGGWGYGPYGGGGAIVVARPTTYRWKEGKLVIDALDPKSKKIVWRGTIKDELSRNSSTVEEKTAYINKVVAKLMQEVPKKDIK